MGSSYSSWCSYHFPKEWNHLCFSKSSCRNAYHFRHGVKQPRNPWTDGLEFVNQCPIQVGASFSQKISLSDEEGTVWWHAHSEWDRATVHGALIIFPKNGTTYVFPKAHVEMPIILGNTVVPTEGATLIVSENVG